MVQRGTAGARKQKQRKELCEKALSVKRVVSISLSICCNIGEVVKSVFVLHAEEVEEVEYSFILLVSLIRKDQS